MLAEVQTKKYQDLVNEWKTAASATAQNEEAAQKIDQAATRLLELANNQQKSRTLDLRFLGLPHLPNIFAYLNEFGVKELLLNDRSLTRIDGLSELKGLEKLHICGTNISSLDLSGLTTLKEVYVRDNPLLTSIDGVDQLGRLETFYVRGTCLSSLDVGKLKTLKELYARDNPSLTRIEGVDRLDRLQIVSVFGSCIRPQNSTGLTALKDAWRSNALVMSS